MPLIAGVPHGVDETVHGVVVRDPYRWLEARDSSQTGDWVTAQQSQYDDYFAQSQDVELIRERVREYLDVETVDQPGRMGNRYFYRRRDKGSEQACIYVREIATGQERRLVNPSTGGRFASVGIHRISSDGVLLAYALKQGGADTVAIHIVDVESGVELKDKIDFGYARGFTFATDLTGFYYCHENVGTFEDHTIRFHRFGEQTSDNVVYRLPRSANSRLILANDEIYLGAIYTHRHDGEPISDLSIARRDSPTDWKHILWNLPGSYRPFLNNGRLFAIRFQGAPNGMLVELDDVGREIRVIVPERSKAIQQLAIVGNWVIFAYLEAWGTVVESWTVLGQCTGRLDIPVDGTIRLLQSQGSNAVFCAYESFSHPLTIFEFLPDCKTLKLWHRQPHPDGQKTYDTRPVLVDSSDESQIPLMLVSQNSRTLKGGTPVVMTGYGGFGSSVTPQYSVFVAIMLELGATFALARIRGGSEFGDAWHNAAKRGKRQNAFDDFIAVAEWLCTDGVTTPEKLAIFGGSNAGLLVGAVLTQRPALFGAALCIAPLLDMVRYEKFDQAARWRHEYGSAENAEDFHTLHAYSPYHHVEEDIDYPPVLFVSGDADDRCNPAHVRKMAARLQQRDAQTHPILVDYSRERGHSPVLPLSTRVESLARRIAFLSRALKITIHTEAR